VEVFPEGQAEHAPLEPTKPALQRQEDWANTSAVLKEPAEQEMGLGGGRTSLIAPDPKSVK